MACGGVRWRAVARGGARWRAVARGCAWLRARAHAGAPACARVHGCACACGCVCVCVYHLNRCKTSNLQGVTGVPGGSVTNEDTSPGPVQTYLQDSGGAPGRNYKSQLVATGVLYIFFFSFLLLGFTVLSLHVRCIPHQ